MSGKEGGSKNVIERSLLLAAAKVLDQFNNEESDSVTMGEMRRRVFEKFLREDMLQVIDYFKSPSDYIINEDVDIN